MLFDMQITLAFAVATLAALACAPIETEALTSYYSYNDDDYSYIYYSSYSSYSDDYGSYYYYYYTYSTGVNIGTIVGGVIGALFFLGLCGAAVFFLLLAGGSSQTRAVHPVAGVAVAGAVIGVGGRSAQPGFNAAGSPIAGATVAMPLTAVAVAAPAAVAAAAAAVPAAVSDAPPAYVPGSEVKY